jgi:hypothetical protein
MPLNYDEFSAKCVQLEEKYSKLLDLNYGFEIGAGWLSIVETFLEKASAYQEYVKVVQIKEKFGSLRIYYSYREDDEDDWDNLSRNEEAYEMVSSLVHEAEFKSSIACVSCGTEENVVKRISYDKYCISCYDSIKSKNR